MTKEGLHTPSVRSKEAGLPSHIRQLIRSIEKKSPDAAYWIRQRTGFGRVSQAPYVRPSVFSRARSGFRERVIRDLGSYGGERLREGGRGGQAVTDYLFAEPYLREGRKRLTGPGIIGDVVNQTTRASRKGDTSLGPMWNILSPELRGRIRGLEKWWPEEYKARLAKTSSLFTVQELAFRDALVKWAQSPAMADIVLARSGIDPSLIQTYGGLADRLARMGRSKGYAQPDPRSIWHALSQRGRQF